LQSLAKPPAEIIYNEADVKKAYMGLKTWNKVPNGKILKSDVIITRSYLNEEHIKELERIVSAYLDLADNRAKRHIVMNMKDLSKFLEQFLEQFLELSNDPILTDNGKVSHLKAKLKAEEEYDKFRIIQDREYESDFDKIIKESTGEIEKTLYEMENDKGASAEEVFDELRKKLRDKQ
jgi:hypothetical protein